MPLSAGAVSAPKHQLLGQGSLPTREADAQDRGKGVLAGGGSRGDDIPMGEFMEKEEKRTWD